MITSQDINELADALASAQGEMGGAIKGSKNPFFKSSYSNLGSVMDALQPSFAAHGLSYSQGSEYTDGIVRVSTRIMHSSGQWIESSLSVPVTKLDSQGVGAAITYAKRYSLQGMAGIPSIDEDGEYNAVDRKPAATPAPVEMISPGTVDGVKANLKLLPKSVTDRIMDVYTVSDISQLSKSQGEEVKAGVLRYLEKAGAAS